MAGRLAGTHFRGPMLEPRGQDKLIDPAPFIPTTRLDVTYAFDMYGHLVVLFCELNGFLLSRHLDRKPESSNGDSTGGWLRRGSQPKKHS